MVSALDIIGNDQSLQEHWLKRLIAIFLDSVIFWVIGSVLTFFVFLGWLNWNIPFLWSGFVPFLSGGMFFLYAFIMEVSSGATIGKKLLNLRAISTTGKLTAGQAAIRNISKIHGTFLLIDWLIGFITDGDPKQKWLDRAAGTTVVVTTTLNDRQQHTYQSQQANYAPPPPQEYWTRHEQTYQYPPASAEVPLQSNAGYQPPPEDAPGTVCNSCGGRLTATGKGRMQCIRCGKIQ